MTNKISYQASAAFLIVVSFTWPSSAMDVRDPEKIWPSEMMIENERGNSYLTVPYRLHFEYDHTSVKSRSGADVVNLETNSFKAGIDFIAADFWLWGVSFLYTDSSDLGSSPFATIDTDKALKGGEAYLARYVMPHTLAGVRVGYQRADGRAVYNGVDVVTEDSDHYDISVFVNRDVPLMERFALNYGLHLDYRHSTFDYVNNIPPSAHLSTFSAHLPLKLTYL